MISSGMRKSKVSKVAGFVLDVFSWAGVASWLVLRFVWPLVRWFFSFYLIFKLIAVFYSDAGLVFYSELFGVLLGYMFLEWVFKFYVPKRLKVGGRK